MTSDIFSSSDLVCCVFFSYFDSYLCESAHKFCDDVFNYHLSFGVDAASGKSGEICPDFPQQ